MQVPTEVKRILLIVAGVLFLLMGLLGLALPFLQGFLFILIGAILLSLASRPFRKWLHSYTMRFPRVHRHILRLEVWLNRLIGPAE